MSRYLRMMRHGRFATLCAGQVVSLFGDVLFPMIVLAVAVRTANIQAAAAIVSTAFAFRFAALGGLVLFGGGLLDQINPASAAAGADALRFVGLIGLGTLWDGSLGLVLIGVALLVGACEAISEPALLLIAPRLVGDADSLRNNPAQGHDDDDAALAVGLLEAVRSALGIAGPFLAASLTMLVSGAVAALVASGAFGFSAIATFIAGHRLSWQQVSEEETSLLRSSLSGLRVMWTTRWLRWVQLMAVLQVVLAVGPWMVAMPLAAISADGRPLQSYGLLLGGFAAGTAVGALVGGRIRVRAQGMVALPSLAVFGITALALDITSNSIALILLFLLGGVGTQIFDVLKINSIRYEVDRRLLGRALSADFFFSFAALPAGQLIGSVALRFFAPADVLRFAGFFVLATGLVPLLDRDVRRLRTSPSATGSTSNPTPVSAVDRAPDVASSGAGAAANSTNSITGRPETGGLIE